MRLPTEVFVFVRRGDEFLVLRRSAPKGGYWHGAAGALEPGETPAEAARRELLEETGLAGEPAEVSAPYAYSLDEQPEFRELVPPGTEEIVVHTFLVDAPPRWEPTLDAEHDEHRWCSVAEAVELLHWPEPREVLRGLAG